MKKLIMESNGTGPTTKITHDNKQPTLIMRIHIVMDCDDVVAHLFVWDTNLMKEVIIKCKVDLLDGIFLIKNEDLEYVLENGSEEIL